MLRDHGDNVDAVIIATGSEVGLANTAAASLLEEGIGVRVISMPNPDLFRRQDDAYRESVLPAAVKARVAVEAGVSSCWHVFVGDSGRVIGVDDFGASAPGKVFIRTLRADG